MNQIEYTAIVTMINSIKSQLQGLETMVATIANVKREEKAPTRTTKKNPDFSDDRSLSEEEEELLERAMKEAQEFKIKEMTEYARSHFEKNMQEIIDQENPEKGLA